MVTNSRALPTPRPPLARRVERVVAPDEVKLAVEHYGDESAPALLFAHGFGQIRHAWDDSATALAHAGWHAITADARGHGDSGRRDDGAYEFGQFIDDLSLIARRCAMPPILVGASMGGLIGMSAQATHAPLFRALVLVDITPRWEAAGVARILGFMRAHPQGFASLDEAGDAIALYLPHRAERKSPDSLRRLLIGGDDGRLRWHWDPRLLDYVAREGEQRQAALIQAARCIRVPTLLISGSRSDVVSDATIEEFLHCVPHAVHVRVDQAAHMVAGDANDAFTHTVLDFVRRLDD